MLVFVLTTLLWQPETALHIGQTLRIEQHEGIALKHPGWIQLAQQAAVVHDSEDDHFWVLSLEGKVQRVFGGNGDGPGQIAGDVVSWFIEDEAIHVIHADGRRHTVFGLDGRLQSSATLAVRGRPLCRLNATTWITQTEFPRDALRVSDGAEQALGLIPDDAPEGVGGLRAVLYDRWLLLATTQGNSNTIYWGVFDRHDAVLHRKGSFPTLRTTPTGMFSNENTRMFIYAKTIGGMATGHDGRFYLTEMSLHSLKHPRFGYTNIVRRLDHDGTMHTFRIYGDAIWFTQLVPVGGNCWLGTSASDGVIALFEPQPLPAL